MTNAPNHVYQAAATFHIDFYGAPRELRLYRFIDQHPAVAFFEDRYKRGYIAVIVTAASQDDAVAWFRDWCRVDD